LRDCGVEFVGEPVNYEDSYWLCYARGPERIIVELGEKVGLSSIEQTTFVAACAVAESRGCRAGWRW
jgi:hypothetical protein